MGTIDELMSPPAKRDCKVEEHQCSTAILVCVEIADHRRRNDDERRIADADQRSQGDVQPEHLLFQ